MSQPEAPTEAGELFVANHHSGISRSLFVILKLVVSMPSTLERKQTEYMVLPHMLFINQAVSM
jgi:hypothetical protein